MDTNRAMTTTVRTAPPYRALLWLAVATFSNGIDGYVLAGLLPHIATGLHVSNAAAGQLVSVFAFTSALAAPVLGAATSGWERRRTIVGSLAVFVIGNLITALAPIYPIALGGRVVAALGACVMNASISGYVIHLAPVEQRGRALSFVLGGWMTATALGVPVGLLLGQSNWRFPLIMVAVVGTVALIGIMIKLPHLQLPPGTLSERLRPLGQPRLLAGLLVSTGILCSSYTCFTYAVLILGPSFRKGWMIILIMFGYGLASMLGNAVTGRLADRFTPVKVLSVWLVGLLVNALVGAISFSVATAATLAVLGLVWFFAAGIGNGGAAVPQQARLAAMAPDSAAIVMALNGSAISLGSALGGALGGVTLAAGNPPNRLLMVAAVILAATLALHIVVVRIGRRAPALR
jgi:MFS transporter, DHA1 family, inner membrane transport protein